MAIVHWAVRGAVAVFVFTREPVSGKPALEKLIFIHGPAPVLVVGVAVVTLAVAVIGDFGRGVRVNAAQSAKEQPLACSRQARSPAGPHD